MAGPPNPFAALGPSLERLGADPHHHPHKLPETIVNDALNSPAFLIMTTYRLHLDDVGHFRSLASRMAADARQRAGCLFLDAAQDVDEPTTFHLMEGWSSQEAFEAHVASTGFQSVLHDAMRLRILDRFGTLFTVSGEQALDMPS